MYRVDVYHVPTEGGKALSKNFKVKEFACKDGSPVVLINPELVTILQKIRDKTGKPLILNSAYRTVSYNKSLKGAQNSMHMYGNAADIHCPGLTTAQLKAIVDGVMGKSGGVGLYASFVHVDCRTTPSRWNG